MSQKSKDEKLYNAFKVWFASFIGTQFAVEVAILLLLFLFFKSSIDTLLIEFAELAFKSLKEDTPMYIAFVGFLILLFAGFVLPIWKPKWKFPNFRLSPKQSLSLLVIGFIYFIGYRFSSSWYLLGWQWLKFADLLFIGMLLNISSWIWFILSNPIEKENKGFVEDLPYQEGYEEFDDSFGYRDYAQQVAKIINKTYPKQSFTIGINGEWGSGKTSFMNMVTEKVSKKDPNLIVIRFNAWESSNDKYIISDFMAELESEVSIDNSYLAKKLKQYASKLAHLDKTGWLKFFANTNSSSILKYRISQILKKSGKRLLILVDDLDRLDTEEVLQVFKMVRNSVNFGNVIFMLAYDRSYLDKAIRKQNKHRADKFLEKIVSSEFSLPPIRRRELKNKFIQELELLIDRSEEATYRSREELKSEAKTAIESTQLFYVSEFNNREVLDGVIRNSRDISRVINGLKVNLQDALGNVILKDFIYLEIIRVQFPKIYKSIREINENIITGNGINEAMVTVIPEDDFKKSHKSNAYEIVKALFPNDNSADFDDPYKLGVKHKAKFYSYFKTSMLKSGVPHREYLAARNKGVEGFKQLIKRHVDTGAELDIATHISRENLHTIDNETQFRTLLEGIFYLVSLRSNTKGMPFVGFINIDNIDYWIPDINFQVSSKFFNGSRDDMRGYIKEQLLINSPDWNISKSEFVNRIKRWSQSGQGVENDTLFSIGQLLEINIQYLERAIERMEVKAYNSRVSVLLKCCYDPVSNEISHKAIEMVKEYVNKEKLFSDLYFSFIGRSMGSGSDYRTATYVFSEAFQTFYDSIDDLKMELEQSNFSHSEEYLKFIELWNSSGKSQKETISFEFSEGFMSDLNDYWNKYYEIPERDLEQ